MKSFVREVCHDFISLFYPRYCMACYEGLAKGEETICTRCMYELPRTHYHTEPANPLFRRLEGRLPLQYALSFLRFRQGGRVQRLLHNLKYYNHPEIGEMLGRVYGEELHRHYSQAFDLIIPIPLHPARLKKRGYNQSEEFARGLSKNLMVPMNPSIVERVIKTETQTRKSKLMRWQNVREVFEVKSTAAIAEKHILLADDVVTTGATIEACAQPLLQAGCASISVVSIAYSEQGKI
jgi:ComF family protein